MNPEMLLSFLRDNGVIDETQMTELLEEQSRSGKSIEDAISNNGVMRLTDLYQMIAAALGTEAADIGTMEFPPELLSQSPPQTPCVHAALPLNFNGKAQRSA